MPKPFSIVVAMDQNRGIGLNGDMPWHLPGDLKHFKTLTSTTQDPTKKNVVIMGRKTWESIPDKFRPLPNRQNLVITRQASYSVPEDVVCADSLDSALRWAENALAIESVFVIGGGQIYAEAIRDQRCEKLYITEILGTFDADTRFPDITKFTCRERSNEHNENGIAYQFAVFQAK